MAKFSIPLVRCWYWAIGLLIKVLASAKSETVRCGGSPHEPSLQQRTCPHVAVAEISSVVLKDTPSDKAIEQEARANFNNTNIALTTKQ